MEISPVTCRTLEEYYYIDGHTFEKQYKETLKVILGNGISWTMPMSDCYFQRI